MAESRGSRKPNSRSFKRRMRLDGVHTVVDSEELNVTQVVDQIRSARPDMLS